MSLETHARELSRTTQYDYETCLRRLKLGMAFNQGYWLAMDLCPAIEQQGQTPSDR